MTGSACGPARQLYDLRDTTLLRRRLTEARAGGFLLGASYVNTPRARKTHRSLSTSPRRHLVEFRQGRIEMVPGVTAHVVRHHLRPVSTWIVQARGVHGKKIRHC